LAVGRELVSLDKQDRGLFEATFVPFIPREERLMNLKRPITASITIGDQPTEADLGQLKEEGYTGVVNLRNDGEPDQPLSVAEEGNKVRALGLDYLHSGVGAMPLAMQEVIAVCDFIDKHSKGTDKVLVHCRRGPRAAALLLLHQARAQHWESEEVFAKGKEIGLEVDGGLKMLVHRFLQDTTR
jgi:uncharacterized protein (TIGR01244 family)